MSPLAPPLRPLHLIGPRRSLGLLVACAALVGGAHAWAERDEAPATGHPAEEISAPLDLDAPPFIAAQPSDRTVAEGARTVFSVALSPADPTASFQWLHDGAPILGATAASYLIAAVSPADAGHYTCETQNDAGPTASATATLIVVSAAQTGRFVNFSVVTSLDTPHADTVIECAVGGAGTSGEKSVLIRAAGPSLARFGIANLNAAPRLELFSGAAKIGGNDHWAGQAAVVEAVARVGAFPFVSLDSGDAAMLIEAATSATYAIRISGQDGATGVVLTEIYDATPASAFTLTTPRLIRFSLLKRIPAGSTVSAGFVIAGQTSRTVLIRAVGPTLRNLDVTGAMIDPVLTLLRDVTPIAHNDDWGDTAELKGAAAAVGTFALNPASKDAALMLSLPHGSYVVQAGEAGDRGGIVLLEIFELP